MALQDEPMHGLTALIVADGVCSTAPEPPPGRCDKIADKLCR